MLVNELEWMPAFSL